MRSTRRLALVALGVAALASTASLTGATFDSTSSSSGSVSSAADWVPPAVSVTGSSGVVSGTASISATASDTGSGVASVSIDVRAAGTTAWTTLCTTTTAPYSCSWATAGYADGAYDVQARATDTAGNTGSSTVVSRTVDNSGPVVSIDQSTLPDWFRGTVTVTASATDAGSGVASVRIQRSLNNGSSWTDLCTTTTSPYSCDWVTSGTGDALLRAIATDAIGNSTTSANVLVSLDNALPTVGITAPSGSLAGTVTLTATASDADSGIASVLIEYRASATAAWTSVCTVTLSPYTCRWDTTKVADGTTYSFRATATDYAGNTNNATSATTSTVDNRVASVSVEDPGAYLRGSVTLTANANAPGGVASVAIQYAPTGTSAWTTVCTDTASPYTCTWDTTKVAAGGYDLRAIETPVSGSALTSALVTNRVVDNSVLRAVDVQATNGGTAGRVDAGDTIAFTYSTQVDPTSLLAGWDGSTRTVALRLRDGTAVGGVGGEDVIDVFSSTGLTTPVNLGLLNTRGNYVKGQAMVFNATISTSTTTVNGATATVVTVRLGTLTTNDTSRATKTGRTMSWTPSSSARSASGQACSTAPVDESGALDRDF